MDIPIRPGRSHQFGTGSMTRAVDRLEGALSVLLLTLALLMVWAAVFAGGSVAEQVRRHEQATLADVQYRVVATVVESGEPTAQPLVSGDGLNAPWSVSVGWTAPDGSRQVEQLLMPGPRPVGDAVRVAVRRNGTATLDGGVLSPGVVGVVGGGFTLMIGWAWLGLIWVSAQRLLIRWNCRRWAAQWRLVEPQWSGRVA